MGVLVFESVHGSRSSSGSWWPAREGCMGFFLTASAELLNKNT